MNNRVITVQDIQIAVSQKEMNDYICITDIAGQRAMILERLML